MKQINELLMESLPEIAGQQERNYYLQRLKKDLEPEEAEVLDLKYRSKRFSDMKPAEISVCSYGLLLKISVVTGWPLPTAEQLLDILIDQFYHKLKESYADFNVEEIEYAVRNYGTKIKDWGKNINLSLLDEVMVQYRTQRETVSEIEQNRQRPMIDEPKLEDITNQDWYNQTKGLVRNRKLTVEFVPLPLYDWAFKENLINPTIDEKWDYMLQAINLRQAKLYADLMLDGNDKNAIHLWTEFMEMKKAECFKGDELTRLRNLSKKLVLFDHFKSPNE